MNYYSAVISSSRFKLLVFFPDFQVPRYVKRVGVALSDMVEWYGDALAVGLDQACPTRGSQRYVQLCCLV